MDTKDEQPAVETSDGGLAIPYLKEGLCVFTLVVVILLAVSFWQFKLWAIDGGELLGVMLLMLMGGVSILGVVGLCALCGGVELGRCFTYPFTVYLGAGLGLIAARFLGLSGMEEEAGGLWETVIAGIIGGVIVGWLLARVIIAYSRWARRCAIMGAIPMMMYGGWVVIFDMGRDAGALLELGTWIMLSIVLTVFALFGGAPGAVAGAIIDSLLLRRAARKSRTVEGGEKIGSSNCDPIRW
ncbi:MAG: hypothetical protein QGH60_02335 [Phycisphaerae bacterium]|jgi:hypothetical protein|nr:hypothetical protein [Phycisphaerae bacterium]